MLVSLNKSQSTQNLVHGRDRLVFGFFCKVILFFNIILGLLNFCVVLSSSIRCVFTSDTSHPHAGARQQCLAQMPRDRSRGQGQHNHQRQGEKSHSKAVPHYVAQHTPSQFGTPFQAFMTVFCLWHQRNAICPSEARWYTPQQHMPGCGAHCSSFPLRSVGWGKG